MRKHPDRFTRRFVTLGLTVGLALACVIPAAAQTAQKKPNILVIWGDDIGYWNISAYNQG
jgi:arylsulfatase